MQPNIVNNYIAAGIKDWTPGRGGNQILGYVAHTTDCSLRSAENTFAAGTRQAAAHDIIAENGDDVREVAEGDTSWGAGNWFVNQRVLNVEHEDNGNPYDAVRTPEMYNTAAWRFADVCRRYGVPCKRGTVDVNHNPVTWGLFKHSEVDQIAGGTSCCDGLDVDRIVAQAQALLGGEAPATVEPTASTTPGITPWGPGTVKVLVQALRVHQSAAITDAGNFANSPDGMEHSGAIIDINGWLHGQVVSQDGQTSDVWLHTTFGHFVWAMDTDFFLAAPNVPFVAPAPAPTYAFTAQPGQVTVTPDIGANIRTYPSTAADVQRAEGQGAILAVLGFISNGGDVNGSTKWWKIADSQYVSDQTVSFAANPPLPTQPDAPIIAPVVPIAPVTAPTAAVAPPPPPAGSIVNPVGPAADIVAAPYIPPAPQAPVQGADPMTIRDYLVAFVAWVMSPFIKK